MKSSRTWLSVGAVAVASVGMTAKTTSVPASTAGAQARPAHPTALTGVSWRLVSGIDVRGWKSRAPTLRFEKRRLGGNSGCNFYDARYKRNGHKLKIGRMAITAMGCDKTSTSVQGAYLDALWRVAGVRIDDGELKLLNANGNELLRFTSRKQAGQ